MNMKCVYDIVNCNIEYFHGEKHLNMLTVVAQTMTKTLLI